MPSAATAAAAPLLLGNAGVTLDTEIETPTFPRNRNPHCGHKPPWFDRNRNPHFPSEIETPTV